MSRPDIRRFVTVKYQVDVSVARSHINSNLRKMLESGAIRKAAAEGRKGAGSFKLPPIRERKVTKSTKSKVMRVSAKGKVKKVKPTATKPKKVAKMSAKGNVMEVQSTATKPKKVAKMKLKPSKAKAGKSQKKE